LLAEENPTETILLGKFPFIQSPTALLSGFLFLEYCRKMSSSSRYKKSKKRVKKGDRII